MIKQESAVYHQLVQTIKKGFSILDTNTQNKIIDFIKSQQKDNGSFKDRAGTSDLYYSLFAHWLCLAIELKEQEILFKQYVKKVKGSRTKNLIDRLSLLLISVDLFPKKTKISFFSIIKLHLNERLTINLAYHFFLLMLVIDSLGKNNRFFKIITRLWLIIYKPNENTPCSILAALIFAKQKVGLEYTKAQAKLLSYNNDSGGFKAFKSTKNSDMLSTAVALFALEKTGYNLWMIKPGCLNFVEKNYNSGAFLSGDGDKTKDLEYTFYGLLALGSLVKYEK